jgi:gliding motility-associated-like protein
VKQQLVAYATPHDAKNELEKLTETKYTKQIEGNSYSGPLEIEFRSNPTPGVQFYQWTIYKASEVLFIRRDRDIHYMFTEPGAYRVECSVNNASCVTEPDDIKVNISESYLRVPNVFTPDDNGQNDEFRVSYRSLKSFHCEVYNRWGKKVFSWDDPAKGWDGTINGRPAAEGAYYYVIRALGTDAGLSTDGAPIGIYNLSGDINLLRGKKTNNN